MAKKDELKQGVRVSAVIDGKTYPGTITRPLPGGRYEVKHNDDDICVYQPADLTIVIAPEQSSTDPSPEISRSGNETAEDLADDQITIEQTITVPKSVVTMSSHATDTAITLAKEQERQKGLAARRYKNRVAKLTAPPLAPIRVRENLLKARLKKVRSKRPYTYRVEQIKAWAKELRIIQDNPEGWTQGCVRAQKKKSAQDYIDGLNID